MPGAVAVPRLKNITLFSPGGKVLDTTLAKTCTQPTRKKTFSTYHRASARGHSLVLLLFCHRLS